MKEDRSSVSLPFKATILIWLLLGFSKPGLALRGVQVDEVNVANSFATLLYKVTDLSLQVWRVHRRLAVWCLNLLPSLYSRIPADRLGDCMDCVSGFLPPNETGPVSVRQTIVADYSSEQAPTEMIDVDRHRRTDEDRNSYFLSSRDRLHHRRIMLLLKARNCTAL